MIHSQLLRVSEQNTNSEDNYIDFNLLSFVPFKIDFLTTTLFKAHNFLGIQFTLILSWNQ
jgi:hypothetical protein